MCLSLALNVMGASLYGATSSSTETRGNPSSGRVPPNIEKNVQPLERTEGARIYTDAETAATFVIPSTWRQFPLSKERKFLPY